MPVNNLATKAASKTKAIEIGIKIPDIADNRIDKNKFWCKNKRIKEKPCT